MVFTTLSLVALLFSCLSSAAPTPTAPYLAPRSCTTVLPDVMINWDASQPTYVPYGESGGYIHVERTGGPNSNTVRTAFSFNHLPPNATGCELQFEYPAVWRPDLFAVGANNFNLFDSTVPIAYGTSWDTQPAKGEARNGDNVATWITTSEYKTNVWSTPTCSSGLSFIMELADWQENAGSIKMSNDGFGLPIAVYSGFSLIYNC